MTALMTLFLVVFTVTIIQEGASPKAHAQRVARIMEAIRSEAAAEFPEAVVDLSQNRIRFREPVMHFANEDASLQRRDQEYLRRFVTRTVFRVYEDLGRPPELKRVVAEGFASKSGEYLLNMRLSIARSQSVLCALFDPGAAALDEAQRDLASRLMFAGGFAFNESKGTSEAEDRRVELKIEFHAHDEMDAVRRRAAEGVAPAVQIATCGGRPAVRYAPAPGAGTQGTT